MIITLLSLAVVYYWSFYHFSHLFEDRVIDAYTFQKNQELGVKNEWILGITTNSIDVVESIHGEDTAREIQQNALSQEEVTKLYRDTIDQKHLLYTIELDTKDGETVYKYSVLKDIYAEKFPQIAIFLMIFAFLVAMISIIYSNSLSRELYSGIHRLRGYSKRIAQGKATEPINIQTGDREFQALAEDLEIMRRVLEKNNEERQNALQYISHEMKTPIMIIEGYATSARDGFYPKGTLDDSLETILMQTHRMKQRVQDLLTIVHLDSLVTPDDLEDIQLLPCIQETILLMNQDLQEKDLTIEIPEELYIRGSRQHIMILLENLVSNQIKYSEKVLSITQEDTTEKTILRFYNDGPQIPEGIRQDLFKPFVKGSAKGSGLGLPICRGIMKQIGGDIRLEDSTIGTVFLLEFSKQTVSVHAKP
ncbi:ATP-binding protein [Anaerotignum sp.]|uniref:sensor histidine kinase n=1 Tax=Anaerotignum sp. TaxID=2039241 RepID=UPI003734D8C9